MWNLNMPVLNKSFWLLTTQLLLGCDGINRIRFILRHFFSRIKLTKVVYTVWLGDHLTFPADYPPPDVALLQQVLTDVRLYITETSEEQIRLERLYGVTLKTQNTSANLSSVEKGLSVAWQPFTSGTKCWKMTAGIYKRVREVLIIIHYTFQCVFHLLKIL